MTTNTQKRGRAVRSAGVGAALAGVALLCVTAPGATCATTPTTKMVAVRISGGHATDPRDGGRPVVLVAAALGVPTEVFRTAFSGVTPAAAGSEPDPAQVQRNKAALLKVLAPYGVTNETLDAASNRYRFNGSVGETWPQTAATAKAIIRHGRVVALKIVRAGAGFSSTPRVTIPGHPRVTVRATLAYGRDVTANGSLASLVVVGRS